MACFALLHSPLLGPATWKPVARELRQAGHHVAVPDLRGTSTASAAPWRHAASVVAHAVEGLPGSGPVVPDPALLADLLAEQPRVPLEYLRGSASVPASWGAVPGAYLRLSPAYEEEANRAHELGWPVTRLDASHLHPLVDPAAVAALVVDLAAGISG